MSEPQPRRKSRAAVNLERIEAILARVQSRDKSRDGQKGQQKPATKALGVKSAIVSRGYKLSRDPNANNGIQIAEQNHALSDHFPGVN